MQTNRFLKILVVLGCVVGLAASHAAEAPAAKPIAKPPAKSHRPVSGKGAALLNPDRAKAATNPATGTRVKPAPEVPSGGTLLMNSTRPSAAPSAPKTKTPETAEGGIRTMPKSVSKAAEKPKIEARSIPAPVVKAPRPVPTKMVKTAPGPKPAKVAKPAPAPKPAKVAKPAPAPGPAKVAKPAPTPKPAKVAKAAPAPKPVKPLPVAKPAGLPEPVKPAVSPKQSASKPAVAPPKPAEPVVATGPKTKADNLADLLELYKADRVTPKQYQERRAQILAE